MLNRTYLLLLLLLLSSCSLFDESGHTTVQGQVVDSITGQAVGPAQVCLFTNRRSSSSSAYGRQGDWRDTDANGSFSFSFEADGDLDYILMASSAHGASGFLSSPPVKGGRKNKSLRVPVEAPAWVRLHLQDVPPRTEALTISVGGFHESFSIVTPMDTVIYRVIVPMESNSVIWALNGLETPPNINRIIFSVAGMDTARIEISY